MPDIENKPIFQYGSLTPQQPQDDGFMGQVKSALAGVGSGVIHMIEGPTMVGASLLDLGLGTDTASKVENYFQNLNVFDEEAQKHTIGKLVDVFVNLAIPEATAFKLASSLTKEAFLAKRAGLYPEVGKLSSASELAETANVAKFGKTSAELTDAERIASFGAGMFGSGIASGIMVGNVKDVGTIGDILGGPTQLNRNENLDPGQELLNRIKFGSESALFNGVIGSTSSVINKLRDRNWISNPASKLDEFFFKKIVYPLRPGGAQPEALANLSMELTGKITADSRAVQNIYQSTEQNMKNILNKLTPDQQKSTLKDFNDLFLSGKPIENEKGMINFGELDQIKQQEILKDLTSKGVDQKDIASVFVKMDAGRDHFNNMLNLIDKNNFKNTDFDKFKDFIKNDFQNYMGTTYQIFQPKNLIPFFNWKPSNDAVQGLKKLFYDTANQKNVDKVKEILNKNNIEITNENIVKELQTQNLRPLTDQQLNYYVDQLVPLNQPSKTVNPELSLPSFMLEDNKALQEISAKKEKITLSKFFDSLPQTTEEQKNIIEQQKNIFESYLGKTENPLLSLIKGTTTLSEIKNKNKFFQDILDLPEKQKQDILIDFRQRGITPTPEQLATEMAKKNIRPIAYDTAQEAANAFNVGIDKVSTFNFPNLGITEAAITNPLAGKYTLSDIANSFGNTFKENPNWSTFNKVYNTLVVLPKYGFQQAATVLSPFAQIRQMSSNIEFLTNNGIIPTYGLVKRASAFLANPENRRILNEAGLENSSVVLGDIKNLEKKIFGSSENATEAVNFNQTLNNVNKLISKGTNFAQDLYAGTDTFLKTMGYLSEKESLEKSFADQIAQGMISKDEIQKMALNVVKATMQNYNMTGSFVKSLGKLPFGSFASYPSEIIRTTTNSVERAIYELTYKVTMPDGNIVKPLFNRGIQRLVGTLGTNLVMPTAAVATMQSIYNVSQDELDALKRLALPEYLKNSTILPIKDKDGNYKYINYSHWNAYEMMYKPIQGVFNAIAQGKEDHKGIMGDFIKGLISSTKEMGEPFVSESMWSKTFLDLFSAAHGGEGLNQEGKQIFNPQDTLGGKFSDTMNYVLGSLNPFGTKQFTRLAKSFAPEGSEFGYDKYGNSYKAGDELLGITGLRPVQVDLGKSLQFKVSQFEKQNRQIGELFTRSTLTGGIITPEQITDSYINTNRALYEAKGELHNNLQASKTLNIDDNTFKNSTARIGKNEINNLVQGYFTPFNVSKNDITAFKQISDKLNISNPYDEASSAIQNIKQQLNGIKLNQGYFPTIENPFKTDILRPSLNAIQNIISSPPTPVNTPTTQGNTTSNTINNATGNTITNPVKQNEYKTIFPFG
jgi:hypothetical protein